jgi:hypothetical protein
MSVHIAKAAERPRKGLGTLKVFFASTNARPDPASGTNLVCVRYTMTLAEARIWADAYKQAQGDSPVSWYTRIEWEPHTVTL